MKTLSLLLFLPLCSCSMMFTKSPDGGISYSHYIASNVQGHQQSPAGGSIASLDQATATQAITTGVVTAKGLQAAGDALEHLTPGGVPATVNAFQN